LEFNRISYAKKAESLLQELKIDYSDYNEDSVINNLIRLRNEIIHTGELKNVLDNEKLTEINKKFRIFISILTRIFLKILNYQGEYYDIYHKTLKEIV